MQQRLEEMCALMRREGLMLIAGGKKGRKNASFCITYCRLEFIAGTDSEGPTVNQGGGRELSLEASSSLSAARGKGRVEGNALLAMTGGPEQSRL